MQAAVKAQFRWPGSRPGRVLDFPDTLACPERRRLWTNSTLRPSSREPTVRARPSRPRTSPAAAPLARSPCATSSTTTCCSSASTWPTPTRAWTTMRRRLSAAASAGPRPPRSSARSATTPSSPTPSPPACPSRSSTSSSPTPARSSPATTTPAVWPWFATTPSRSLGRPCSRAAGATPPTRLSHALPSTWECLRSLSASMPAGGQSRRKATRSSSPPRLTTRPRNRGRPSSRSSWASSTRSWAWTPSSARSRASSTSSACRRCAPPSAWPRPT